MAARRLRPQVVRATVIAVGTVAAGTVGGVPFATALLLVAGLLWGLVRWPHWEERVFRPAPVSPVRAQVVTRPVTSAGLGADGHRAFAQALHAVTAVYLEECEREAER